ncbi:MAG: cytochrome P450 family protein, partial [Anaerolineales bacterium]
MPNPRKYELYGQAFRQHAHEVFAQMRREDPVFQQPGLDGKTPIWFITRYAEVEQVLRDDQRFVRDPALALSPEVLEQFFEGSDPQVMAMTNNHMLNKDGEDHHRLRMLVSKAFTRPVIQGMRPRIAEIAEEILDGVEGRGQMELVNEYAFPLPIIVIAELLGIPTQDRDKFRTWSNAVVTPVLTEEEQQESARLLREFVAYMQELVARRRENPEDDLLSGLIQAEEQGDRLSESELFSMLTLLIVAGHETTVTLISNAVLALLRNPAQLQTLIDQPEAMVQAVEELLRYDSPVERALTRWVAEDVELAGQQLQRGDLIIAVLGSANRDENHFEDPTELDLTRNPNQHLAFGKGAHYCLGSPLARLEAEIALNTLFQRFPDLALNIAPEDLAYRDVPLFRSLKQLP